MFLVKAPKQLCNIAHKPVVYSIQRNFNPKGPQPQADDRYRGEKVRRFGYEPHHHVKGLLPRLDKNEKRLQSIPFTTKEGPWSRHKATEGQNDFIRILGDEDIEQHELLTHIPDWLRGYKNMGREYSVLMRKRKEFEHWKVTKPLKWLHLEQRIKFLYRRINNKYQPPEVEKLR